MQHALCAALEVSRSAYYGWLSAYGVVDKREEDEEQLVLEAFLEHKRRYGLRPLVAELKARGVEKGPTGGDGYLFAVLEISNWC